MYKYLTHLKNTKYICKKLCNVIDTAESKYTVINDRETI